MTSQAIGLISYPILSRIYTPQEFGIFALFSSLVIVGSIFATLTYEFSIPLSKTDDEALKIFKFSIFISLIITAVIFLGILAKSEYLSFKTSIQRVVLLLLPLGIFLHSLLIIKTQYYTYTKSFKELSISKVLQTTFLAGVQISMGLLSFGFLGLIAGHMVGRIGFVSIKLKTQLKRLISVSPNFKQLAKQNSKHPLFVLPSSLINALSKELPVFLVLPFFGEDILGQYSLAFKVLIAPVLLVSSSIDSVFFQSISQALINKKAISTKLLKLWGGLFLLGVIPFTALFIWGDWVFAYIFGSEWSTSGNIASVLSILLFLRFIYIPTAKSMIALSKEKWMPIFSVISLLSTFLALYLGYLSKNYLQGFIYMSIAGAFIYICQILFVFNAARKMDKSNGHN